MPIQLLPTQLANQIAAGEVVERPASVVKELVENSIDAKATEIIIDIEKGGSRRIRVRDNGLGIVEAELTLALSRHATSKIATLDDLEAILSLGFRGEALASVSSVSRLTLTSKTAEQQTAYSAFCEGRDMSVNVEPASHPVGTTVDVEDLFFNTPARRKFLRTEKTEFSHIEEVVRRIALAHPEISFKLIHNAQLVRHFPALKDQGQRIARVVGKRFAEEALVFNTEQGDYRLWGWIAPPDACRHQNDLQYFYVNGRMMRDRLLNHAVRQAYAEGLAEDRQPSFVIYFQLPPRDVDVNVHPAKHEVRFHQSRHVHDFVLSSLRKVLAEYVTPLQPKEHDYQPPDPSRYQVSQPPAASSFSTASTPIEPKGRPAYSASASPSAGAIQAWGKMLATPLSDQQDWHLVTALDSEWGLLQRRRDEATELALVSLAALRRVHVLHQLQQALEQGLNGQPLLLPTQLDYPNVATLMSHYTKQLAELGIQLRLLKPNQCAVLQVPAVMRRTVIAETMPALLNQLVTQSPEQPIQQRQDILELLAGLSLATQGSVNFAQIQQSWQQLSEKERPPCVPLHWRQAIPEQDTTL